MVRSLGAIGCALLITTTAYGEPPDFAASEEGPGAPSCAANHATQALDAEAEEHAFAAELETFIRRKAFTERLIAQRNTELFEQAIARQARIAKLQRELAEREKERAEREFENALVLYLKKRELTRERSAAASRTPLDSPSDAPPPPPVSSPPP